MPDALEKKVEEWIFKANQSGKRETSGLVSDLRGDISRLETKTNSLKETVKELVEKVTIQNGRVKTMENKWNEVNNWIIRTLFVMVVSLIVYIFMHQ